MSHAPHDDDRETKMEPIHGPVVLAILLFGGLAYWLLTRGGHPPGEASPAHEPGQAHACSATIKTDPAGVDVVWGHHPLGKTPLDRALVPCGPARVQLRHPLFSDVRKDVVVSAGTNFVIHEKLEARR